MGKQIAAVMAVKKETPGTFQFEEIDGSPHYETIGRRLSFYVPKVTRKTMLEPDDTITVLVEAGDQRPS